MTNSQEIHAERMRNRPQTIPAFTPPARVRTIIARAAEKFETETKFIRDGRQRSSNICAARRTVAKELNALGYSTTQIALYLGGLNHSSVVYMLGRTKRDHMRKRRGPQIEYGAVQYPDLSGEWAI
jgi:chromosomal replication initiation ATPase DnaA